MNWEGYLFWGFVATCVFSFILSGSIGLRLTRMNLFFILGTFFTKDRERALFYGSLFHFLNGWIFGLIYVFGFHLLYLEYWWLGIIFGLFQGLLFLTVGVSILPGIHPHMAGEEHGPQIAELLEPPGFMGMNYGKWTPIFVLTAHLFYGLTLGFYVY